MHDQPMRDQTKGKRASRTICALATGATLLFAADAGAAIDLSSPQSAAGQWDMSLNDTNRKCRITLHADSAVSGFVLAMPAGCRRAMPILADVGSWKVASAQILQLDDAGGKVILEFAPGATGLSATGPEGETYQLSAANGTRLAQAKPVPVPGFQPSVAAAAPPPPTTPAVAAKPVLPAAATLKPAELSGRYSIFREGGKDTGCMLTLDDKTRGLKGNKAALAPACRDQGLVIFDPAGWSLEKGHLTLTARKGHQTHLDLQDDGMWLKDPKEGKSLSLKKL